MTFETYSCFGGWNKMWTRKTAEDDKHDQTRSNFTRGNVIVAVILAVVATLLATADIHTFAGIVMCFVIFFAFSCVGIVLFNDPTFIVGFFILGSTASATRHTDICNTCHSVVQRTDKTICQCGGRYEPLEHWKWVEENDTTHEKHSENRNS
ncbi:MAG: hypothetical protein GY801_46525 [bacterium]|nr:hypothetical protein [bacterium]